MEIVKAIIPAAGLGTRFYPLTKCVPKEMLPLINKPAIQYIAEEALQSQISNFIVITNKHKPSIADHFDGRTFSEHDTTARHCASQLESIEKISRCAEFSYIRQPEPLGLGHAVWLARHHINKEYFAIALPDDIIVSRQPALAQLMRIARQEKASIIAVQEVPTESLSSYGVVAIKKQISHQLFQLSHIVEKPHPKDAPSSLAVVGRYVLSHKLFQSIETISSYSTGEIQLTDAINHLMQNNERVFAYKIQGSRYDIGTPLGWIKAVISMGMNDQSYGPSIKKYIAELHEQESALYNPATSIEHLL